MRACLGGQVNGHILIRMLADVVNILGSQLFAHFLYFLGGIGALWQILGVKVAVFLKDGMERVFCGLPCLLCLVEGGIEITSFHHVVVHRAIYRQRIAGESHDSDVLEPVQGFVTGGFGEDDSLQGQRVTFQR